MFTNGDTLFIMPTRFAGNRAITPFSNLSMDKLDKNDILKAKSLLSEKGYDLKNAIVGGGDLWTLSPKERNEYINFICGEFEHVIAEVLPTQPFECQKSNCSVSYIFDLNNSPRKSRELFVLNQLSRSHLKIYLTSIALKYGYNNCVRLTCSVNNVADIEFKDWVYKSKETYLGVAQSIKRFKKEMSFSRLKTSVRIKNLEPSFDETPTKTAFLFPSGVVARVSNGELKGI